jgi:hypothetical protein
MKQIKSIERVRDLGEVYTHEREVNAMLDLVKKETHQIGSTFLEPACGNGNFLVAILDRKLKVVHARYTEKPAVEYHALRALASIYGIDICQENVTEAKQRLLASLQTFYKKALPRVKASAGFREVVDYILETNIQQGDTLNETEKLRITQFTWHHQTKTVEQAVFRLQDLIQPPTQLLALEPNPSEAIEPLPYLALAPKTLSSNITAEKPRVSITQPQRKRVLIAHA